MKIAVVTIAKNERQFIERWYESAKEADYLLIADTGSTDGTYEHALHFGAFNTNLYTHKISINPWRFDDARNAALALVPDDIDYVINLDMDEVLVEGWREHLENATATRPRYTYTWSWADTEETQPGLQYNGDKIVRRHGYRWKHPVHEVMVTDRIQETQEFIKLEIHHHPDHSKSRGQYFPLLEQAVLESPMDDRNSHYLGREYMYHGMNDKAAAELKRHLSLPTAIWKPERAQSMRFLAKVEPENALEWLTKAIEEDPGRREPIVDLALWYYKRKDWQNCYWKALDAIAITQKPLDYMCEEFAWGYLPYDLAALAAHTLGFKDEAVKYGTKAMALNPNDERLARNLIFYRAQ